MSSRRKSGRITNKTLGKFTNAADDPINLDTVEKSNKKDLKRKKKGIGGNGGRYQYQRRSSCQKGNKLQLTDTESEEVEPRVKKGKKLKQRLILATRSKKQKDRMKTMSCVVVKMAEIEVSLEKEKVDLVKKRKKGKEKVYDTDSKGDAGRLGVTQKGNKHVWFMRAVLAHFVVDRLKPKRMEIVCKGRSLKITPGLIHKLWGIPNGGIQVESIVPSETYDASVSEWRAQFEGRLLATRTLVERTESTEDEDAFNFRMNFIMLFMIVLVEFHKNGRAREGILRGKVNQELWEIIEETIQHVRDSPKVDIETVKQLLVQWEETKNKIELHLGLLEKKTVWLQPSIQNEEVYDTVDGVLRDLEGVVDLNINDPVQNFILEQGMETREKIVGQDCINEENLFNGPNWSLGISQNDVEQTVKEGVVDLNINDPVQNFILEQGMETREKIVGQDCINEENLFNGPNWSLGISQNDVEQTVKGPGVTKDMDDGKKSSINPDEPSWSLGVSQIGTTTSVTEHAMETDQIASQFCLSLLNETPMQDVTGTSGGILHMDANEKKMEELANIENETNRGTMDVNLNDSMESPGAPYQLHVWDLVFNFAKQDIFCGPNWSLGISQHVMSQQEKALETPVKVNENTYQASGLQANVSEAIENTIQEKELTIVEANWLEVIAKFEAKKPGWVLNQERVNHQERLDKFTENMDGLVKGDLKLADLKLFDMVFFPVLEFNHYYLINFELKNSAISVIDNFHESIPLVGLRYNADYYLKDSPYKVKDVFVQYLKQIQHPKIDDIHAAPVQKLHLPWATKTNVADCAAFVMRHMEKFMVVWEQFNCGFSTNGKKKKSQLNLLTKRFMLHLLRSEVNVLRDTILTDARKK
ncbi:hypothetical protein E3N88_32544 [Mikania micrantha]|uniref:Ubiquitin-like protease family profile domain-containing protein n=1 Tax=Mikania micrantha TaxID=192012 RepID=A0A5N6M8S4_9ASTR|nr:hypothetical protein E3N88_32544 [Mikania micrantha]